MQTKLNDGAAHTASTSRRAPAERHLSSRRRERQPWPTACMQALLKVGRMEVRARATHDADHLTDSFDQRTEGAGASKCGFKQVFVADAGTWEQNLNSPIDHSDSGEAGGGAARPTRQDGRTPPRHDESERGGARGEDAPRFTQMFAHSLRNSHANIRLLKKDIASTYSYTSAT